MNSAVKENTQNEIATREEMIEEACRRLQMLDLHSDVLRSFKKDNTLYYSERRYVFGALCGVLFWVSTIEKYVKIIKDFEEKHNAVVYHATLENMIFGKCLDLFYVNKNKEEWIGDHKNLRNGRSFVYVVNLDDDACSEFGTICFKECAGGLVRTA